MFAPELDLDAESRRALEFDDVLARVAEFARTPVGTRRVLGLVPLCDGALLAAEIEAVAETRRARAREGNLLPAGMPDPGRSLALLAIEDARLEPSQLRDLAALVDAAARLRVALIRLPADESPHLIALGRELPDLRGEAAPILAGIESDGSIADHASPDLRRLRRELARISERLQRMLLGMMRRPDREAVIQDEFVTQRNGRFVIPIRTDAPRAVQGIVHATSSSGATQFVEPLETVPLNNECGRLAELEQREIERILADWTQNFRRRLSDVHHVVETLATVDGLQARALFGEDCGGVLAEIADEAALELIDARHPLLDLRLREAGTRAVPLTLTLDPADQVLVLSGPNTGGKTVALKTLGLAVLMAQCAVPVPAATLRMPRYRQLRADIGDHQSIEADLSTYSAHVRALAAFLSAKQPPALFLFDEIGSGTEPSEGAALARSVLETLLSSGMTVMATTHQEALKAWALTTPGAAAAAMDFDTETLQPTYLVRMGAAGVSAGLDIAGRLGIASSIVERARSYLTPDRQQSQDYVRRLRDLTAEVEARQARLEERERAAEEETLLERSRMATVETRLRADARRALDEALARFKADADRELQAIRDAGLRQEAARVVTKADRRVAAQHALRVAELAPAPAEREQSGWVVARTLGEGMRVRVVSLGREGHVRQVRGSTVEVLLGSMAFTVDREDLRVPSAHQATAAPATPRASSFALRPDAPREVKLIGMRVDEALGVLDKFLDAAALAGHAEVRVIHGHGTGRLRTAVRAFLAEHVHVKSRRAGSDGEGGEGATVVLLHGGDA